VEEVDGKELMFGNEVIQLKKKQDSQGIGCIREGIL
jgi:hypothetical protein